MDTLTHALSGALLARATAPTDAPPRSLPRRIAAGFQFGTCRDAPGAPWRALERPAG